MPINISNFELAEVTDGKLTQSSDKFVANGVEFDSRSISGGELFVAINGEKVHGHQFVEQAYEKGASLFLVESLKPFDKFPEPGRLIEVSDTLKGFSVLANWWREKFLTPLIGVTGSVGKTTVKELLASILLSTGRGYYSFKSYNGLIGVPYNICHINSEHEWVVLEIGMSAKGEIDQLSKLAKPDVAIITKIAPSHIGSFGSLDSIADAKCEIVNGMKEGAVLILNRDDKTLMSAVSRHKLDRKFNIQFFGYSETSDLRIVEVKNAGIEGVQVTLAGVRDLEFTAPVIGKHNALNIAAAILGAHFSGRELTDQMIINRLAKVKTPKGRMEVHKLVGDRFIVDDSYNANPTSMSCVVEFAHEIKQSGKKIGLIFGDMLELGEKTQDYHQQIIERVKNLKPDFLIVVGSEITKASNKLDGTGIRVLKAENAKVAGNLASRLAFDVLIVKASRSIGLDLVLPSFEI